MKHITNYKPKEFAELLNVSVKTLQRWDRDKILIAKRTLTDRRFYTTDSNGKLTLENEIVPYGDTILKKKKVPYSTYYTVNVDRNYTRALVKVEKEGFYISENESVSPINNTVTLIKPEDYFKASIMEDQFKGVREQLKIVLSGLRVKSYLTDASLDYHSIGIYEFKGSKYIELNVKSTNVYNSIKLNKYDIGKKLYETTIVKLLDYLSLINDKTVAGVNVRIEGSTKNFMNENDTPTKIKYDFIMKTEEIKNYKNKDITSQRLLDNSVILMDNERVELKLQ